MALPISYNVRNLIVRWKVTLLAIGGIALVVAVMLILAAMSNGFRVALRSTGSPDNMIVIQRGANSELTSGFSRDNASMIVVDDRVARDAQGRPLASPEIMIVNNMARKQDNNSVNVVVRGVTSMALAVKSNVHLIEGRMFTPGLYELVVGKKAHERYIGLDIGQSIKLQRRTWKVVGVFDADGSGFESEIWGDLEVMGPAFNRSNGYSSLTLRLKNPADIEKFNEDLKRNPSMQVEAMSERAVLRQPGRRRRDGAARAGRLRGGRHGHRRGLRRDEHDVRHRRRADARDRHAARARLLAHQHPRRRSCWSRRSWPSSARCSAASSPSRPTA